MKRSLPALAFLIYSTTQAQSWCPPGAMWTHEYADVMMNMFGVTRVVYEGDTAVAGYTAQKLRETNVIAPSGSTNYTSSTYPPMITRYADGIVYVWEAWTGTYDTLMWFSAAPGQRWTAPGLGDDPFYQMLVLDTSTVVSDGVPLQQLLVQRGTWDWMPPDTLRERIGFSFNYLNGWSWFVTDQPWNGLQCYRDDELAFEPAGSADCDYTLSITSTDQDNSFIQPNPGIDQFAISLSHGSHLIRLFDTTGREVLMDCVTGPNAVIGTAQLLSGIYTVRVDGERPLRWVKQ